MTTVIQFKRGDTFMLTNTVTSDGVTPVNITMWSIRAHVKDETGTLVSTLTSSLTTPLTGNYTLTASGTAAWPVKRLLCDIEYTTAASQVVSTETFAINVLADVTT